MATFDENGKYIKTDWKAGDKITAIKLNKIEESLEAINDNDISRHVEADARLDALESGTASDKQAINAKVDALEDVVEANKDAANLEIYSINQHMTLLDKKIDDGVAEVEAIANTVDGKIAAADASMKAQINSVNTSFGIFQNTVNTQMNEFQNEVNDQLDSYLPLIGGTMSGDIRIDKEDGAMVITNNVICAENTPLFLRGGVEPRSITVDSDQLNISPDGNWNLGSDTNKWYDGFFSNNIKVDNGSNRTVIGQDSIACETKSLWLRGGVNARGILVDSDSVSLYSDSTSEWNLGMAERKWQNLYLKGTIHMDNGTHNMTIGIGNISSTNSAIYLRGGANARGLFVDSESIAFRPDVNDAWKLGDYNYRWQQIFSVVNLNVSSDRSLKENIEYVGKAKSGLTYEDMYNFVRDDLGLATYNFIGDDKQRMNFIAQDLLVNADGSDNKIGQMIVNPVAVPAEEDIENGTPYPTLSYDSGMYTSVLAGALKEAINKIEQLEARINELENK